MVKPVLIKKGLFVRHNYPIIPQGGTVRGEIVCKCHFPLIQHLFVEFRYFNRSF